MFARELELAGRSRTLVAVVGFVGAMMAVVGVLLPARLGQVLDDAGASEVTASAGDLGWSVARQATAFGIPLTAILAARLVASEYEQGWWVWSRRRGVGRTLVAKWSVAVGLGALAVSTGAAIMIACGHLVGLEHTLGHVLPGFAATLACIGYAASLGSFVGFVSKRRAAAIAVTAVWTLAIAPIARLASSESEVLRWSPPALIQRLTEVGTDVSDPVLAALSLTGWAMVSIAVVVGLAKVSDLR